MESERLSKQEGCITDLGRRRGRGEELTVKDGGGVNVPLGGDGGDSGSSDGGLWWFPS